jgi:hypothetical protein
MLSFQRPFLLVCSRVNEMVKIAGLVFRFRADKHSSSLLFQFCLGSIRIGIQKLQAENLFDRFYSFVLF